MNRIKNIVSAITLLTVALTGLGFSAVPAHAADSATEHSYIAQLRLPDQTLLADIGTDITRRFTFTKDADLRNVYSFTSAHSKAEVEQVLGEHLVYIEENREFKTKATITLSDPGFTNNARDTDKQWGLVKAGFVDAWNKTTGSLSTVVAVIDTGIDETHEDFSGARFVAGYNFINRTPIPIGVNSDDNSHGTIVAGIIGAIPNNRKGIAGTNWEVGMMPLKALDRNGSGNSADISEAIVWASDNGAHIINLSVGGIGFGHDKTLANSVTHAFEKDVVIVAAAGNDVAITGGDLDVDPVFPICDDNGQNMVIGVAASDVNDLKPGFSNFGRSCVDVVAPGRRILSLVNRDPVSQAPASNAYAYASGTSMSVPFVVGQAALLKSLYPHATNKQIRDRIIATADNIDSLNLTQCNGEPCTGRLGAGRINVAKSLEQQLYTFSDGDVVGIISTNQLYYINGGRRHLIVPFVFNQRFSATPQKTVPDIGALDAFPEGSFAEPKDGTLIKQDGNQTVYAMQKGLKLPVTYQVFLLRGYKFTDVVSLPAFEINSWITGSFLAPPEGTLVRTGGNPTVYWVVDDVLHPINFGFYQQQGLNVFPVVYISDVDLKGFSKGEAYIR